MEKKNLESYIKQAEEAQREMKIERMRERVVNSKHLVSNRKKLAEAKAQKQANFKQELSKKSNDYQNELARRLMKVYSKPLNFEKVTGKNKDIYDFMEPFKEITEGEEPIEEEAAEEVEEGFEQSEPIENEEMEGEEIEEEEIEEEEIEEEEEGEEIMELSDPQDIELSQMEEQEYEESEGIESSGGFEALEMEEYEEESDRRALT